MEWLFTYYLVSQSLSNNTRKGEEGVIISSSLQPVGPGPNVHKLVELQLSANFLGKYYFMLFYVILYYITFILFIINFK